MKQTIADAADSVLVVVDYQPVLLDIMEGSELIIDRACFLIEAAAALNVPILATEQNPRRMGGSHPSIAHALNEAGVEPVAKMSFSCCGNLAFMDALKDTWRKNVVLIGIESHICLAQTALQLRELDYDVIACVDAMASRTKDRHQLGLERIQQAGGALAHSESIVYEWMETCEHEAFKTVLGIVKAHP